MIVVADTTPLHYLVVIEREYLLPALFGRVLASRPSWLEIRQPIRSLDPEVNLDWGEREAIALAEEVSADLLLADDWDARQEAERRHLRVVGTLRVLADGARRGLTNLEEDFEHLRQTNFRVSAELLESFLDEHRRSKGE